MEDDDAEMLKAVYADVWGESSLNMNYWESQLHLFENLHKQASKMTRSEKLHKVVEQLQSGLNLKKNKILISEVTFCSKSHSLG